VIISQQVVRVELVENAHQTSAIPVIGHTSSVVDLTGHILKCLPRNLVLLLQEHLEHLQRNGEIAIVELVSDVPPKRSELATLLQNRVEERQAKQQLLPWPFLGMAVPHTVRNGCKRSRQIGTQTTGRLVRKLDTVLQHRYREVLTGHRRQPQTELRV